MMAGGECWTGGDETDDFGRGRRAPPDVREDRCDDGGGSEEMEPGLLSPPPRRAPPPLSRSRRWADEVRVGVDRRGVCHRRDEFQNARRGARAADVKDVV